MTSKTSKDAEEGVQKGTTTEQTEGGDFKVSDIQTCGKYVSYLTLVYFIMVLTQVCNLLFMTFAG